MSGYEPTDLQTLPVGTVFLDDDSDYCVMLGKRNKTLSWAVYYGHKWQIINRNVTTNMCILIMKTVNQRELRGRGK